MIPDVTEYAHRLNKEHAGVFKEPNIINIIMQAIYIGTDRLVRTNVKMADIVIEPKVAHIGAGEFQYAQELIHQGELAAQERIPQIKKGLESIQVIAKNTS